MVSVRPQWIAARWVQSAALHVLGGKNRRGLEVPKHPPGGLQGALISVVAIIRFAHGMTANGEVSPFLKPLSRQQLSTEVDMLARP
jgi:hypothetical protein